MSLLKTSSANDFLWTERFRPKKIDDVIIPAAVKAQFKAFIAEGEIQHLLLTSPCPGTGKTTTALALCFELGIERPLFINASLNNSIEDIRMQVTQYATTVSLFEDIKHKVVILDECERLSRQAQDALKGLIEHVSSNCRFILTANTKSQIIEPLQSRCANIDFMFTKEDEVKLQAQMFKRCTEILTGEGVKYDTKVLALLTKKFFPDNRRLLTFLQTASKTGEIDVGSLANIGSSEVADLVAAIRDSDYNRCKQVCLDNADRWGDDFYGVFFKAIDAEAVPNCIPQIVLIIGDYQRYHSVVPDRFLHFLAFATEVGMQVKFK